MSANPEENLDIRRIIPGAEIAEDKELKDQIRLPDFMRQSSGSGMEGGPALRAASFMPPAKGTKESAFSHGSSDSGFENRFETEAQQVFDEPMLRDHNPEDIVRVQEEVPEALRTKVAASMHSDQFDNSVLNEMTQGDEPQLGEIDPAALHELMQQAARAKEDEHAHSLRSQQVEAQLARLKSAVEVLRSTSQALAEQARSDAVEIGFEVARHLLKQEVSQDVSGVMSFAKQAMAQVGQAREITVRLHPEDVARAEAQGLSAEMEEMCTAQVTVQSAPDLTVGDVELDTDLGCVDGRIETRLKAMYAALKARDRGAF